MRDTPSGTQAERPGHRLVLHDRGLQARQLVVADVTQHPDLGRVKGLLGIGEA
jgi:hypothetical protein